MTKHVDVTFTSGEEATVEISAPEGLPAMELAATVPKDLGELTDASDLDLETLEWMEKYIVYGSSLHPKDAWFLDNESLQTVTDAISEDMGGGSSGSDFKVEDGDLDDSFDGLDLEDWR